MNEQTKLMLSDGEMQLVNNTDWILTKHKIIATVNLLLGTIAEDIKEMVKAAAPYLPAAVTASTPKIAKGENYRLLPYVILDYPRCFDKEAIFAVRTMFWWGNFFSCTLQLSGTYKTLLQPALLRNIAAMQQHHFYICCNTTTAWEHHFGKENYLCTSHATAGEIAAIIQQQHFVKVAAKFSLHQWNEMEVLLKKSFSDLLHLLKY